MDRKSIQSVSVDLAAGTGLARVDPRMQKCPHAYGIDDKMRIK
jgi:hypothetical protein